MFCSSSLRKLLSIPFHKCVCSLTQGKLVWNFKTVFPCLSNQLLSCTRRSKKVTEYDQRPMIPMKLIIIFFLMTHQKLFDHQASEHVKQFSAFAKHFIRKRCHLLHPRGFCSFIFVHLPFFTALIVFCMFSSVNFV